MPHQNQPTRSPHPDAVDARRTGKTHLGWIIAFGVVAIVWAAAFAIRNPGGHDGEIMAGWADGLDAGQVLAKESDRPMVVMFTADW